MWCTVILLQYCQKKATLSDGKFSNELPFSPMMMLNEPWHIFVPLQHTDGKFYKITRLSNNDSVISVYLYFGKLGIG